MANARGHETPDGGDATVSRATIFEAFGNSIRDIPAVANTTARAQKVTDLTTAGEAPSSTKPLYVYRADAPGLHRIEVTQDGSLWLPASGVLRFADLSARNSWTTSNSGLLSVRDRCVVGTSEYAWDGAAWVPEPKVRTFRVTGSTDANGILAVTNPFAPATPTGVQLTPHSTGSETLALILDPIVWTTPLTGSGTFNIRFRRNDTNGWATTQPVACFVTVILEA
jgi:hypothetical protein